MIINNSLILTGASSTRGQLPREVRGDHDGHGPFRATIGLFKGPGAEIRLEALFSLDSQGLFNGL